ncbi:hypothetical protein [Bradyrhizobium pachyrhizi]|uniref:hypothetical protein n=1 Tax=Bradyrhizobium pachyrhizi TaxID=280333 RepID=UPI00128F2FE1|nr:hypothetical protein [Bradyrhizobium pachyrhizi]
MGRTRREVDSLGEMEVPSEAQYGATTLQAFNDLSTSGISSHLSQRIHALFMAKKAAVLANAVFQSAKLTQITTAYDDICTVVTALPR